MKEIVIRWKDSTEKLFHCIGVLFIGFVFFSLRLGISVIGQNEKFKIIRNKNNKVLCELIIKYQIELVFQGFTKSFLKLQ